MSLSFVLSFVLYCKCTHFKMLVGIPINLHKEIYTFTFNTVSLISTVASASKASWIICASCIVMTIVGVCCAFVNIYMKAFYSENWQLNFVLKNFR